jgi:hypothetical protein
LVLIVGVYTMEFQPNILWGVSYKWNVNRVISTPHLIQWLHLIDL